MIHPMQTPPDKNVQEHAIDILCYLLSSGQSFIKFEGRA